MTLPNVLVIMADQLVANLTGVYGHPVVRTPNLERLAKSGIRFDAAYCPYPVCSPSRSSFLSGRFASENAAWDNAAPVASDIPMLPHYLASVGYETALTGKMHFVGADQLHGFEKRLTTDMFPGTLAWTPERGKPARFVHPGNPDGPPIAIDYVHAGPVQWNEQLQFDEETHFRALEYIRSKRTSKQGSLQVTRDAEDDSSPWLLVASYHHPHEPFQPPRRYWEQYADADVEPVAASSDSPRSIMDDWVDVLHGSNDVALGDDEAYRRMRRAYFALVTYIDDKVGELLDALEECGLAHNTLVIFTSDHGDMLGERGMVQKRVFYEWSSRVPLLLSGQQLDRQGEVCDVPVSLVDIVPTICELVGVPAAAPSGRSLLPLIGNDDAPDHGPVFVEYHSEGVHAPCFMCRDGQYKYIYVHGHDEQLFNLEEDPHELCDLSVNSEYSDIVARCRAHILERFDPEEIEARIRRSLRDRSIVKDAMMRTGARWDYTPDPEQFTSYWRTT